MAEGHGGSTEDGAEGEHGGGFRFGSIFTEGNKLEAAPQVSPYEEQDVSGWGARLMFGSKGSLVLRSQMLAGASVSPVGRRGSTAVIGRICTTSITAAGEIEGPCQIVNLFNDSTRKPILLFGYI